MPSTEVSLDFFFLMWEMVHVSMSMGMADCARWESGEENCSWRRERRECLE